MPSSSGLYFEFLDETVDLVETITGDDELYIELLSDSVTLIEVSDTEYFEIYDGSFGLPTAIPAENLPFTYSGPLQAGIGLTTYPIKGGTFTILSIAARVSGAPTGSSVIIDINKNGSSIYGNQSYRPTVLDGTYEAVVGTHNVSQVVDGDYLSLDIDQVGSAIAGAYLTVVIRLQRIA